MPIGACVPRGWYAVQPSRIPPRRRLLSSGGTAAKSSQKLRALSRGKAISLEPIMIGMMKFPSGPDTTMIIAMIITMPWVPMSEL
ncbi:unannotated protein [freshwater metagenome]|uniref:Unannotated protein n=1 Tax=freshwater metagenome TaxID=449393 RepID=A0A6J7I4T0_9ZZZZ